MEYNLKDLKKKSVINVTDGRNLGNISDLILNYPSGVIKAIILPGKKGGLFQKSELEVGFGCIERVGNDVILVKLCENKTPRPSPVEDADCAAGGVISAEYDEE